MGMFEIEPIDSSVEDELAAELRSTAPPGWMNDPLDRNLFRYWDGERWTGHERRYVHTSLGPMTIQSPPGHWDEPEYMFDDDGWGFELGGGISRP
jgi:hypothetical protein